MPEVAGSPVPATRSRVHRAKVAMLRGLAPWTRYAWQCLPSTAARRAFWNAFVRPHMLWREFEFHTTTRFGARMEGHTGDTLQRHLCYFGVWEPNLTAWIARRLQPGDFFVDVGANIGYYSLLAGRLVGPSGRVVAIEASPTTFALLQRQLRRNRADNVRAVNLGVSDRATELQLYVPPGHDLGRVTASPNQARAGGFTPSLRVPARPLTAILDAEELRRARILKIDVEGLEPEVLSTLLPVLNDCHPDIEIVAEITPSASASGSSAQLLAKFAACGFNFYHLENEYTSRSYLEFKPPTPPRRLRDLDFTEQRDLVFSRHDAEAL